MTEEKSNKSNFITFKREEISNLDEKLALADAAARKALSGQCIGVGSGSTSFLALEAIGKRVALGNISNTSFIPSSLEMEMTIARLGLQIESIYARSPDWVFDGADEVSPEGWLIKGRGGALFREKLLFRTAVERIVLVDRSKLVERLGDNFPVPVEVHPLSVGYVTSALEQLEAISVEIRRGSGKDGPVITENGNLLLDVQFAKIYPELESEIKKIVGVIESGLFINYDIELINSNNLKRK
jgi:ribose 5-phosphate isomerase A